MRYQDWKRTDRIEKEYREALYKISIWFDKICKTSESLEDFQSKMQNLQNSKLYEDYCIKIVGRMVTPLAKSNYKAWRMAARRSSKSKLIYEALLRNINDGLRDDIRAQILDNASLIRSLPSDIATKVVKDISALQMPVP